MTITPEEALKALRALSVQVCAEWTGPEETHPENILRSFIAQSCWQPIETRPTTDNTSFLILLPKNDVADFVQIQVSIFEGKMYPDALDGMIDWWNWVAPEQATHWRPCYLLPTSTGQEQ